MDRKTFLRNGILGGTALATMGKALGAPTIEKEVVGSTIYPLRTHES
jgi:hypothetical protein